MKKHLFLAALAVGVLSCKKETLSTSQNKISSFNLNTSSDPRIGTIIKWKCFGGDTLFTDTLKMKLESISLKPKKNVEYYTFSFNQPIWTNTSLYCSSQDIQQMTQIAFTSPDCKTAYFMKLP